MFSDTSSVMLPQRHRVFRSFIPSAPSTEAGPPQASQTRVCVLMSSRPSWKLFSSSLSTGCSDLQSLKSPWWSGPQLLMQSNGGLSSTASRAKLHGPDGCSLPSDVQCIIESILLGCTCFSNKELDYIIPDLFQWSSSGLWRCLSSPRCLVFWTMLHVLGGAWYCFLSDQWSLWLRFLGEG